MCGSDAVLHWGQRTNCRAVKPSWERRLFVRLFECFRLGTAISALQLQCQTDHPKRPHSECQPESNTDGARSRRQPDAPPTATLCSLGLDGPHSLRLDSTLSENASQLRESPPKATSKRSIRIDHTTGTAIMRSPSETLLGYLPSPRDDQRLAVFRCESHDGQHYELRQQSWGNGLGWFTQNCVAVDSEQAAALRNLFGVFPIDGDAKLRVVG